MATKKLIDFNVNDYVWVKLTDVGLAELKRQHMEFMTTIPILALDEFKSPDVDADGFSRWQLWDLMSHFGNMVGCGFDQVFETAIKIEVEE